MSKVRFQLRIMGAGVSPETVAAGDVADILKNIEEAVAALAQAEGLEVGDAAVVALVGVEDGSDLLTLAIPKEVGPAFRHLPRAIRDSDFSGVPRATHEAAISVWQTARARGWDVELSGTPRLRFPKVTLSPSEPLPDLSPIPEVAGSTVLYGQCLRVGGVKPKAEIRLLDGGLLYAEVSEQLARALGERLYEEIAIRGAAVWDTETWVIRRFTGEELLAYKRLPPTQAFELLTDAGGSRWDGVDPQAFVSQQRYGEPERS